MDKKVFQDLKKMLQKDIVKKNFDLINNNSYKVPCIASVVVFVNSLETFSKVMTYCSDNGIEPIIIGNGTNVIFANVKLDRLVMIFSKDFNNIYNIGNCVIAESGASLIDVLNYSKNLNLSGMEESVGIPGSVGGAVCMNASAFDFSMDKVVKSVLVYNNGKIKLLDKEDLDFGYRKSRFTGSDEIILRVELELKKEDSQVILDKIKQTIIKRQSKQKIQYPNAGSVFKNGINYFAGELIDKCGLKNYNINDAYVSNNHANFIVNKGNATGQDIVDLIEYIKKVVYDKLGIELELEQKIIGDENVIRRLSHS